MKYECPTCKRVYVSPVNLLGPPVCSGGGRHRPRNMTSSLVDNSQRKGKQ